MRHTALLACLIAIASALEAQPTPTSGNEAPRTVRLVGDLEISQTIQNDRRSVYLLTGKPTWVRMYLRADPGVPLQVRGTLRVRLLPSAAPITIRSLNAATVHGVAAALSDLRADANSSLNFMLPSDVVASAGTLVMEPDSIVDIATGRMITCDHCEDHHRRDAITAGPTMRLRVVGLRYGYRASRNGPVVTAEPSGEEIEALRSWLERAYPVSRLEFSSITMNMAMPFSQNYSCVDANAQLQAVRQLDIDGGRDARTRYYGLVSTDGGFMRGCAADIPDTADPSVVASGPAGPGMLIWPSKGNAPMSDWYGGHEIAHTLGRPHVGSPCGDVPQDNNYPYLPDGRIGRDDGFLGLDFLDARDPSRGVRVLSPMHPEEPWHDVMSYCDREWVSFYTYNHLYQRLNEEEGLSPREAGVTIVAAETKDGAPENAGIGPQRLQVTDSAMQIVATLNLTRNTGAIRYVNRVSQRGAAPVEGPARARVRLIGSRDTVLAAAPLSYPSDKLAEADSLASIDVTVDPPDGLRQIDLLLDERVVATRSVSAPESRLQSLSTTIPAGVGGGPYQVVWQAPRGARLTYAVQLSADSGRTWETLAVGLTNSNFAIDRALVPDITKAKVRIITNDGLRSSPWETWLDRPTNVP